MARPATFFTIGHSTLDVEAFLELLHREGIDCVVDVRRFPYSRRFPWYNQDRLAQSLSGQGIEYVRIEGLGGRRGRQTDIPADVNGYWRNDSFHNYADYALHADFQVGLEELLRLGQHRRCAIMCAESVWWRCHRRIISDYLIAAGAQVRHIMTGATRPAELDPHAVALGDGRLVYPASDAGAREMAPRPELS